MQSLPIRVARDSSSSAGWTGSSLAGRGSRNTHRYTETSPCGRHEDLGTDGRGVLLHIIL